MKNSVPSAGSSGGLPYAMRRRHGGRCGRLKPGTNRLPALKRCYAPSSRVRSLLARLTASGRVPSVGTERKRPFSQRHCVNVGNLGNTGRSTDLTPPAALAEKQTFTQFARCAAPGGNRQLLKESYE